MFYQINSHRFQTLTTTWVMKKFKCTLYFQPVPYDKRGYELAWIWHGRYELVLRLSLKSRGNNFDIIFTIILRGIGLGLSDTIRCSFTFLVGLN